MFNIYCLLHTEQTITLRRLEDSVCWVALFVSSVKSLVENIGK